MQSTMDGMTGNDTGKPKLAVVRAHDNIFARLAKGSNEGMYLSTEAHHPMRCFVGFANVT